MTKENQNPFHLLIIPGNLLLIVLFIFFGVLTANELKQRTYIGIDLDREKIIYVSGEGTVSSNPDFATINFSVIGEASSANGATNQVSEKMNKVISFLKEQNIEDADLKTMNVSVYPRYEYQTREMIDYPYPPEDKERVLAAYEASQSLEVKIRDLDKSGIIIEGAVKAGANQIGGLSFDIEDQQTFKNDARNKAIQDAKIKAEELAIQLGVKLKRVVSYNENDQMPYLLKESRTMDSAPLGMGEVDMEIEPGEQDIKVIVNIGYEIQY
jgi:uncharacterized protein